MFPASLFSSPHLPWAPEFPICHLPESSQAQCLKSLRAWAGKDGEVLEAPAAYLPLVLSSLLGFLCSPALLIDSCSLLPPHVQGHGCVWCVGLQLLSLFPSHCVSAPFCLARLFALMSLLHLRLYFVPCTSGGEQARGLSQDSGGARGPGPWLLATAIPHTGCVTTKQCPQPSGSASCSVN